ncbi:glycosyltransferase family A protein [Winogradskyella sediminis]|uniref:glycosyltransferase family A protein n=1 Tax=Winogradskyella sediminis TaxID=1382466 RepID=UPI000E36AA99|nr:glycosyltransferase family 2 protein [Winogradskyella sediminis]REG87723.1 glycosyltransferase involved in cell wall biosynthesis [Winogradskyella sediminis]
MEKHLVSVIIPTYNNPKQLKRAVMSVFNQKYKKLEIIIIDDGSSVDYSSVIAELETITAFPLYYFKKENEGPGLARQFGLNRASGVFFQYLDSDDELLSHKIENQVKILEKRKEVVMVYGLTMVNHNENHIHRAKNKKKENDNLMISVLEVRKWHTSSCLWRYDKHKSCWSNLFNGEDVLHDFTIALQENQDVVFVPDIVLNINIENEANRLSNAGADITKRKRLIENGLSLNFSMYNILKEKKLIKEKLIAEPLAERFYHAAMKTSIYGDKKNSLKLIKMTYKISFSKIKKMECFVLYCIVISPIKNKRKVFQLVYKLRRRFLSSDLHQFRFV